ncbi:MAG: phosphoribosylaminoimidazolesuccinocarboxamide synthase [Bacteroidales bacterium]|nr:phosphoribosylaminoimidazolesuccinocarboxamide synthase [Bacteroidales bacterium]
MAENELIYDGKEKKVYSTSDPDVVRIYYNDIATAYGGIKQAALKDKGICNNRISSIVFRTLTEHGISNHFIRRISDREQLCRRIEIIPLQIIVRNRLAGTTARMLGVENGTRISNVVFELRYNCDELMDPMINEHHAVALGLLTYEELKSVMDVAAKTNEVLKELFHSASIELVDFKMEVGRASDGCLIVSDEISPDNCRLWDEKTGEVLDKDRFRHDMSDVCASYREVMERLIKVSEQ